MSLVGCLWAEGLSTANWKTDADQAWLAAQRDQRPMLLYITSQNCLYCRKMEHDTFSNQKIAQDLQHGFVTVNVLADKNPALVKKFRVQSYPTTVIVSPKSGVVDYMVGYVGPGEFSRRLNAATHRNDTAATAWRQPTR
jgi:protein disulfide-isomerase